MKLVCENDQNSFQETVPGLTKGKIYDCFVINNGEHVKFYSDLRIWDTAAIQRFRPATHAEITMDNKPK